MALPLGGGAGGIGLIIVLLVMFLGGGSGSGFPIDVGPNMQPFPAANEPIEVSPEESELTDFVRFVVADVQDSWARSFAEAGLQYEETQLVLFRQATQTGCGTGQSATGPFYCPLDKKVYLDLVFFRELQSRFGAPGDFAQAYVIAHEFGHHVQNLLGVSDDVRSAQQEDPGNANELSVRLELQADCFAGIWAHSAFEENLLESGDLEEGLAAAAAVGDDRIQSEATGRVDEESFTHGSSEQRTEWFQKGFESGDPNSCDTYSGDV
jgi:predicted metalloprotease